MARIVFIDDEYLVLKWLQTVFPWDKYGIEIAGVAEDGKKGFDLIRRERPDIVICDIKMPLMDGLELMKAVRDRGWLCKFIILSGFGYFEYAQQAVRYGASDYLLKPVHYNKMVETVEKVLADLEKERRLFGGREVRQALDFSEEERGSSYSRNVLIALQYIEEHMDKDVPVEEIAGLLHIGNSYFSTIFKREVGMSFVEYCTGKKMETAKKLLENKKLKIQKIAELVGYQDPKYFSQVFKKYFGRTPKEYRSEFQHL